MAVQFDKPGASVRFCTRTPDLQPPVLKINFTYANTNTIFKARSRIIVPSC